MITEMLEIYRLPAYQSAEKLSFQKMLEHVQRHCIW
jgi:hypothetical protein